MKGMILFSSIVLLAAVLVIVAAHACWFGLTLNLEIKPVEVLTLAVSIVIAVLLQYFLVVKSSDLRAEKDILIGNISEVLTVLRSCRETLNSCHGGRKITPQIKGSVLSQIRQLSNGIDSVQLAIDLSQCKNLASEVDAIWTSYLDFKTASTGGSFPSIPYTAGSISDQERCWRSLHAKLQSLIFRINRSR
jgi:hypothetical protein